MPAESRGERAVPDIVPMHEGHWPAVRAIYQAGLETGHGSFAATPPADWRSGDRDHLADCSLVAVDGDAVTGWAALAPVSGRCVYAGVAEVSLYVAAQARGRGVGRTLLSALIARSEGQGLWTLQAGVFPENAASLRVHEACGFVTVGLRRRLGHMTYGPMAGRWRDVVLLERRSDRVGTDESGIPSPATT